MYVKNPMNAKQVSKIPLEKESIDCIVFWTKDPTRALEKLEELDNYPYYFQYTLNPYDESIERRVPPLKERIETFKELSWRIGRERVVWRYDPIFLTREMGISYHLENFHYLSEELGDYTCTVMISILDYYKKIRKNMEALSYREMTSKELNRLIPSLKDMSQRKGLNIFSCAEDLDLKALGIEPGRCIDHRLVSQLLGQEVDIKKDKNQREVCGCVESIEVGVYNTCLHGCRYCYANFSDSVVKNNCNKHDPKAPLLIGHVEDQDKITPRKIKTYRKNFSQMRLFND